MKKITCTLFILFFSYALFAQENTAQKERADKYIAKVNPISNLQYFYDSTTDKLLLSADQNLVYIAIYNILGQKIVGKKLSRKTEKINVSVLKAGIYLVNLKTKYKRANFKIVKH